MGRTRDGEPRRRFSRSGSTRHIPHEDGSDSFGQPPYDSPGPGTRSYDATFPTRPLPPARSWDAPPVLPPAPRPGPPPAQVPAPPPVYRTDHPQAHPAMPVRGAP
jgi:hypothetical protein